MDSEQKNTQKPPQTYVIEVVELAPVVAVSCIIY